VSWVRFTAVGCSYVVRSRWGDARPSSDAAATIRRWNQIAIDASGLDHTPIAPGEARVFGEQLGPGRSSRAMAIVHIAMFEAANHDDGNAPTGQVLLPPKIAISGHEHVELLLGPVQELAVLDALPAPLLDRRDG
jgi:hypothetical protein